jgi:hypothetical protein
MKKNLSILAIILLFALILPGCTRVGSSMNGSGKIVDDDLKVEGFSSLNIKGPFEVEVIQSKDFKVTLSIDENMLSRVKVTLERKTLNLSIEAPATFFPTSLKLKVEMPALIALTLSGEASATVNGFKDVNTFTVFLSGKSILNCAVETSDFELNVSGTSEAIFKGKAHDAIVDVRGASKLEMTEFESTSAKVKMTEASEATMNVTGMIDITLAQASKFYYVGNPIFHNTDVSGGSSMAHK